MLFRQLFDPETSTYTYLLADPDSREAVLIDPVREHFERDKQLLRELDLTLKHTLETHVHADHITASGMLRNALGSRSVASTHGGAACADILVDQDDTVSFGPYTLQVRRTPGHTSGCVSYVDHAGKRVFTGDALLIRGCGRTDFQQGSATTLYASVHEQLFTLPDDYAVFPGHDYKGRTSSTIGEEKAFNPRLGSDHTQADFVQIMDDLHLGLPKKIAEAVPANLACGLPPTPEPSQWADIEETPTGIPEVSVDWVRAHMDEVRLIDVRQPEELTGPLGAIAQSESVPLATLADAATHWDRNAPIVVLCRSGGRSGHAALGLLGMGFDHVASMRGGMLAYNETHVDDASKGCG